MADVSDPQRWDVGGEVVGFSYPNGTLHEITENGLALAWVEDAEDAPLVAAAPELLRLVRAAFASPMIDWRWYADNTDPELLAEDDATVPALLDYGWLRAARTVLAQIGDEEEGDADV